MPLPGPSPRTVWLAGGIQLLIAAVLAAPVLVSLGYRRWPLFVGAFVAALLVLGALERRWQARPLPRRHRPAGRRRFRIFPGGKGKGGNGHAHDVPGDGEDDAGPANKNRWLM
jgi:hypothetical protein